MKLKTISRITTEGELSPVGVWNVQTEGDCEGRSIRSLGVFEGHIVDIAASLAQFAMYDLSFSPATKEQLPYARGFGKVSISLPIGTGTWDIKNGPERAKVIGDWLRSEPTKIMDFSMTGDASYAGTTISFSKKK